MKRFSEFAAPSSILDGEKIRIDDILNVELIIIGYKVAPSKYEKNKSGKCLTLQIQLNDVHRVVFTGSDVLISQIELYAAEFPFIATIKKIDRFYSFS